MSGFSEDIIQTNDQFDYDKYKPLIMEGKIPADIFQSKDRSGHTLLTHAVEFTSPEVWEKIPVGVDFNGVDDNGRRPLCLVSGPDAIKAILGKGADPNFSPSGDAPALYRQLFRYAGGLEKEAIIELVKGGADDFFSSYEGCGSPMAGSTSVYEVLKQRGWLEEVFAASPKVVEIPVMKEKLKAAIDRGASKAELAEIVKYEDVNGRFSIPHPIYPDCMADTTPLLYSLKNVDVTLSLLELGASADMLNACNNSIDPKVQATIDAIKQGTISPLPYDPQQWGKW